MPLVKFPTGKILLLTEVLLIALIAVIIFRQKSCTEGTGQTDRGTADSTFHWKNKYNELVTSQKATAEQFSAQDATIKHLLDSIAGVYKTKNKRIQELIIASTTGKSDVPVDPGHESIGTDAPVAGDPCPPKITWMANQFRSPYYLARVRLGDSAYLRIHSLDTITYLWKTVQEGSIFKRKKYLQLDINHANPDITITDLKSFRRLETVREFSIGPEARLLYLDREIRPLAGLGLSRQTGRWLVSLSGGKDFSRDLNIKTNGWWAESRLLFKLIQL